MLATITQRRVLYPLFPQDVLEEERVLVVDRATLESIIPLFDPSTSPDITVKADEYFFNKMVFNTNLEEKVISDNNNQSVSIIPFFTIRNKDTGKLFTYKKLLPLADVDIGENRVSYTIGVATHLKEIPYDSLFDLILSAGEQQVEEELGLLLSDDDKADLHSVKTNSILLYSSKKSRDRYKLAVNVVLNVSEESINDAGIYLAYNAFWLTPAELRLKFIRKEIELDTWTQMLLGYHL